MNAGWIEDAVLKVERTRLQIRDSVVTLQFLQRKSRTAAAHLQNMKEIKKRVQKSGSKNGFVEETELSSNQHSPHYHHTTSHGGRFVKNRG